MSKAAPKKRRVSKAAVQYSMLKKGLWSTSTAFFACGYKVADIPWTADNVLKRFNEISVVENLQPILQVPLLKLLLRLNGLLYYHRGM